MPPIICPNARATIGLSTNFNGAEIYQALVRNSTTTRLTPSEIHQTGLRELNRIQTEMAAIRKELKFDGTAEEFDAQVLGAPPMRFHTEQEILAHGRDIAKRIDPVLPRLFKGSPACPTASAPFPPIAPAPPRPTTRRPPSTARAPAISTCAPSILKPNRSAAWTHSSCMRPSRATTCRSPSPAKCPTCPSSGTAGYTAYSEGWGLYAETLGVELGVYDTPFERYGKLQSEIMRAARLVVDTGVHALGWTREQAIAAMRPGRGGWLTDDLIASEVDRYIAIPVQALAYKIGGLRIEELRRKAETALGPRFNIRDFHDVVLRNGGLPLDILEEQVDAWIAATRK